MFEPPQDESDEDRDIRRQLAWEFSVKPGLTLYKSTKNGVHAWEAYRDWRGMAGDHPLPRGLLDFFDHCAAQLETAKTRDEVCRAVGMGARGSTTNRRGGATRQTLADNQRNTFDLLMAFSAETQRRNRLKQRAQNKGVSLPAFPNIYAALATEFGLSARTIENKISKARKKPKESRKAVKKA